MRETELDTGTMRAVLIDEGVRASVDLLGDGDTVILDPDYETALRGAWGEKFDRWLHRIRAESLREFAQWAQESDPVEHPFLGLDEVVQAALAYAERIEASQ